MVTQLVIVVLVYTRNTRVVVVSVRNISENVGHTTRDYMMPQFWVRDLLTTPNDSSRILPGDETRV